MNRCCTITTFYNKYSNLITEWRLEDDNQVLTKNLAGHLLDNEAEVGGLRLFAPGIFALERQIC